MTPHRTGRAPRTAAYYLMAAAGLASIVFPTPALAQSGAGTRVLAYVWAGALVVGGVVSALPGRGRWLGERVGLWPLIVTFFVYAVTIATTAIVQGRASAIAGVALLAAVGLLVLARWREVVADRETPD